jgi:hypothetical protein
MNQQPTCGGWSLYYGLPSAFKLLDETLNIPFTSAKTGDTGTQITLLAPKDNLRDPNTATRINIFENPAGREAPSLNIRVTEAYYRQGCLIANKPACFTEA